MRLNRTHKDWHTVTIMTGVMGGMMSLYSSADHYSNVNTVLNNHEISNYINDVDADKKVEHQIAQHFLFNRLVSQWKEETMFLSSAEAIIGNPNFQAIVNMGKNAVPYIVDEIRNEPSTLVWALNIIFDRKITDRPGTTVEEACRLWVRTLTK